MRIPVSIRIAVLTSMAVGLMPGPAGAVTFLDTSYGTPTGTALGRSAAMGASGVSLYHGNQAVVQNPALLALEPERVRVDFLFGVTQAAEDRLVPLFDSFDSFVDETTIATNRNTYAQAQGGVLWRLPSERPMTLSAGVFERYDFDFDYFEELRDPDVFSSPRDRILENRTFDVEGTLRSLSAGYGAEVVDRVHLGFSVHRYFGDVSTTSRVADVQNGTATIEDLDRDLTGWGWSVGAHARPLERVEVAVSFEGPFTVDGTHTYSLLDEESGREMTFSSEEEIEYPGTLRFGLAYHPRNVLGTTFTAELVRRFWEDLDDSFAAGLADTLLDTLDDSYLETLAGLTLRDTWDFRLGLEHVFYNGLPVRFGFRYLENYADEESERSIYSVGIGYRIESYRFDVTGLYHRQTTRQGFIFDPAVSVPGGGTFPSPNSDAKVEDSILQIVFGVSRGF
ncbi:MAG: OmpP1/FadL family transporter [Candidatus Krumholzibacteriia bacterium]